MALAPGRGVREDQRRDPLPLAGGRSRRRGARSLRHQAPGSQGSPQVSEADDETLRPASDNRDRPPSLLPSCNEDHWKCGIPGVPTLTQQSGGELTPASPATRAKTSAVQITRIRSTLSFRPCRRLQHLQPAAPSHLPPHAAHLQSRGHRSMERRGGCCVTGSHTQDIHACV